MAFGVVAPGLETELEAGGDVLGEVVEVEGLLRNEVVFLKRVVIDRWVRLNAAGFVGEDVSIEEREYLWEPYWEGLGMKTVCIGKKNEAEATRLEVTEGLPHR